MLGRCLPLTRVRHSLLSGKNFDTLCDHNSFVADVLGRSEVSASWQIIKALYGFLDFGALTKEQEGPREVKEEDNLNNVQHFAPCLFLRLQLRERVKKLTAVSTVAETPGPQSPGTFLGLETTADCKRPAASIREMRLLAGAEEQLEITQRGALAVIAEVMGTPAQSPVRPGRCGFFLRV